MIFVLREKPTHIVLPIRIHFQLGLSDIHFISWGRSYYLDWSDTHSIQTSSNENVHKTIQPMDFIASLSQHVTHFLLYGSLISLFLFFTYKDKLRDTSLLQTQWYTGILFLFLLLHVLPTPLLMSHHGEQYGFATTQQHPCCIHQVSNITSPLYFFAVIILLAILIPAHPSLFSLIFSPYHTPRSPPLVRV